MGEAKRRREAEAREAEAPDLPSQQGHLWRRQGWRDEGATCGRCGMRAESDEEGRRVFFVSGDWVSVEPECSGKAC